MNWINCSQSHQDYFAFEIIGKKGTYVEIGAYLPIALSNTYNLVVSEGWDGFSVEIDIHLLEKWQKCLERKSKVFWSDAMIFDYKKAANELNFSKHFNYLSIDIEPPANTMAALKKVIEDGLTFDVITFEHDNYQSNYDYHTIATEFLIKHGYKVAVYDVWAKSKDRIFETWYVKDDIDFKPIIYDEWLERKG